MFILNFGQIGKIILPNWGTLGAYLRTTFPKRIFQENPQPRFFPIQSDNPGFNMSAKVCPDSNSQRVLLHLYLKASNSCGTSVTKTTWDPEEKKGSLFCVDGAKVNREIVGPLDKRGVKVAEITGNDSATQIKLKVAPSEISVTNGDSLEASCRTHFAAHLLSLCQLLAAYSKVSSGRKKGWR